MRLKKSIRQTRLLEKINKTPFITDEELAKLFSVSIQTIRLDRLELQIPELRERIKSVATDHWDEEIKSLPLEEVIGEIIDLELDKRAISILNIKEEHVFSRNKIARGHHLFAQANSLAVAVINDELALTNKSEINFKRQVKLGEKVVCKAKVTSKLNSKTTVEINSYVKEILCLQESFSCLETKKKGLNKMQIAIDAMGGDNAPQAIVEGAIEAIKDVADLSITLIGDEEQIKKYLTNDERITIIHTKEVIDND